MRRGRLPEPGEVLFATSQTTLEELELLLRRWAGARARGHERRVFVVADVHVLSYSSQVAFVERLRALARERGAADAATLLLVSGRPRQVALAQLSSQSVELAPLDARSLRGALARAFEAHCGATSPVGDEAEAPPPSLSPSLSGRGARAAGRDRAPPRRRGAALPRRVRARAALRRGRRVLRRQAVRAAVPAARARRVRRAPRPPAAAVRAHRAARQARGPLRQGGELRRVRGRARVPLPRHVRRARARRARARRG